MNKISHNYKYPIQRTKKTMNKNFILMNDIKSKTFTVHNRRIRIKNIAKNMFYNIKMGAKISIMMTQKNNLCIRKRSIFVYR
jgi:hypothetical protein